jgi:hypothetical protein
LQETAERFPEAKTMLNMRLKEIPYKDPSDMIDPHKPARNVGGEVPNNVMKIEHNYSKKVKKHYKKSVERRTVDEKTIFDQLISNKD